MDQKLRVSDIPNTYESEVEHLRQLDADLPDFAWRIICRFRPRLKSHATWQTIRPFVIAVVLGTKPREFDTTRSAMTTVTRFTAWVWSTTGAELTVATILRPTLLTRFVGVELAQHSATYRFDVARRLGSIIEASTGARTPRLPNPGPGEKSFPYSTAHLGRFHSWAIAQNSDRRRHNAYAILALCGGAGLTAAELVAAQVEDITLGVNATITTRGESARTIPVLAKWRTTLERAIDGRTGGPLFHGNRSEEYPPRLVQGFLSEQSWDLRISPARLRLTWIVRQINNNLPMPVLMSITGFSTCASFQPYLRHLNPLAVNDFTQLITGAGDTL